MQRNWVRASTHARAMGLLRRLSRDIAVVENLGIMALRSGKKWSEMDLHVERPLEVIEAIREPLARNIAIARDREGALITVWWSMPDNQNPGQNMEGNWVQMVSPKSTDVAIAEAKPRQQAQQRSWRELDDEIPF